MIKPNELRIGNLVKYLGTPYPFYPLKDGVVQVEEVLSDGVNRSHGDSTLYESDKLEGITLTPEWLDRFGFEKGYKGVYTRDKLDIEPTREGYQPVTMGHDDYVEYGMPIQYVHELQNLYLDTNRKELIIKETL